MGHTRILIYGAYGYTGERIARLAKSSSLAVILAGRNVDRLASLGEELGFGIRALGLDDPQALDASLSDIDVVLHCAGPFGQTSRSMVNACLRTRTHYLDISGELTLFETLRSRSAEAETQGIVLLPGVGFDVVPSDCLASHLWQRLPDASHLSLGLLPGNGEISRATAMTVLDSMGGKAVIRRNHELLQVPMGSVHRKIDFGQGLQPSLAFGWGDLSTAHHSTGIPNIEFYFGLPGAAVMRTRLLGRLTPLLGTPWYERLAMQAPEANSATVPSQGGAPMLLWGEVRNGAGTVATSRLQTCDGYKLTTHAALRSAVEVAAGKVPAGFHTPSTAFGADFVLELPNCQRTDL